MSGRINNYSDIPKTSEYGEILEFRDWLVVLLDLIVRLKGTDTPFDQNKCTLSDIIGQGEISDTFLPLIDIGDKIYSLEVFEKNVDTKLSSLSSAIEVINLQISDMSNVMSNNSTNIYSNTVAITNINTSITELYEYCDDIWNVYEALLVNVNNLTTRITSLESSVSNIQESLDSITGDNSYIIGSTRATKIVCSTSKPSSGDDQPYGTLWFVY